MFRLKKPLDSRGIVHYVLPAIVVVGVGVVGAMVLHFANADQVTSQATEHWHYAGTIHFSDGSVLVKVYDCRNPISDTNWTVKGEFIAPHTYSAGMDIDEWDSANDGKQ